ncbi:MAG: SH3 domain-containing protein [Deltaproteobacteria bacterium]|nr:SH3 domain-containing protein [Deltaproteobacteria bacterium]
MLMTKLGDGLWSTLVFGAFLFGCGGTGVDDYADDTDFGDEVNGTTLEAMTVSVGGRARVVARSGLNLRTQPTTAGSIITAMPYGSTVDVLQKQGSWFSVKYGSKLGWSYGAYLDGIEADGSSSSGGSSGGGSSGGGSSGGATSGSTDLESMLARARSGVGFSYHWGGGCWSPESSSTGACYGSCPSCSHKGTWGADCSGYVAKIWQVPGETSLESCGHPYSSADFYSSTTHWSRVSRSSAKPGDAFVRNGHIFLYNGGDAWGSMRAYEAKGCSYGIVYNSRTADSSYRVIRRD